MFQVIIYLNQELLENSNQISFICFQQHFTAIFWREISCRCDRCVWGLVGYGMCVASSCPEIQGKWHGSGNGSASLSSSPVLDSFLSPRHV